jgi:hypothetical protein
VGGAGGSSTRLAAPQEGRDEDLRIAMAHEGLDEPPEPSPVESLLEGALRISKAPPPRGQAENRKHQDD